MATAAADESFKTCTKCGLKKAYHDFHADKNKSYPHLASNCKSCRAIKDHRLNVKHKEQKDRVLPLVTEYLKYFQAVEARVITNDGDAIKFFTEMLQLAQQGLTKLTSKRVLLISISDFKIPDITVDRVKQDIQYYLRQYLETDDSVNVLVEMIEGSIKVTLPENVDLEEPYDQMCYDFLISNDIKKYGKVFG